MNKYLVPIRINGQIIKTVIFANSIIHARLIGEWQFGIGNVVSTPTAISEDSTQKPLTPPQARVKALQSQADRAKQAVKAERARQAIAKAQQQLSKANQAKPTL